MYIVTKSLGIFTKFQIQNTFKNEYYVQNRSIFNAVISIRDINIRDYDKLDHSHETPATFYQPLYYRTLDRR